MSMLYFWNMRIRAPLMGRFWAWAHRRWYPFACGYACDWVYPYGFVPEANCPVHDK